MKTRFLALILLIALMQMACALVGGAPDATQAPVATNAPTRAATQPSGQAATQPAPTATQAEPTAIQPAPTPDQSKAPAGPASLDLSDATLFQITLTDYTERYLDQIEGLDPGNSPFTMRISLETRYQSQPSTAWYSINGLMGDEFKTDSAIVDGQLYTISVDGSCTTSAPGDPPPSPYTSLSAVLTGQAQQVETGVEINGFITDRYAIQVENLVPDAQIELKETITDGDSTSTTTTTIHLQGTGNLYRARLGGFVVRLELADSATATENDFFFAPGSEMKSSRSFELIQTLPDMAPIAPPSGCQVATTGGGDDAAYPMMDDATVVMQDSGNLFYQTNHSLQEVQQFYLAEMVVAGWKKTNETTLGMIVVLTFAKNGQSISITLMETGDTVSVQITPE
ncbi:MAG: hypothetical protein AB1894_13740 [Chloroflexota bacterium]